MHEGVDLVAPAGTPIMAAADGIVVGAEPKGRYGNWIEIEHEGKLATVYGHLSAFAPGIEPGARVEQGDLIGFIGSTGRTTGPHLHFEILVNGQPINPIAHPATKHGLLRGPELVRFRKLVARRATSATAKPTCAAVSRALTHRSRRPPRAPAPAGSGRPAANQTMPIANHTPTPEHAGREHRVEQLEGERHQRR